MISSCHIHPQILKAFLPSMMEKNHGHIVSIASIAGIAGAYQLTDYCASKFAAGKWIRDVFFYGFFERSAAATTID